ncbi:helix-turn-helix domain-containing protein [Streptomyces kronopolitis]|uniref:helix-turn-helix domain-containing protein n=1 Tax=Streptomyces kronopolitis TaxID=1612435 RepID=UPI0036A68B53
MLDEAADTRSNGAGAVARRTVEVVRALQTCQQHLGRAVLLSEVASEASLSSGTVCRYLQALLSTGTVRQHGPRGAYVLDWLTPVEKPRPTPSQAISRALTNLQTRTGQTALLYSPFHLAERPMRICTQEQWGLRPSIDHDELRLAPLGIDPPGRVLAAAMTDPGIRVGADLREVRHAGYAAGPAVLEGYDAIAAPLWRGSTIAGALTLMPAHWQMQSPRTRRDFVTAVMETAGTMSGYLTRRPVMHAA